MLMIAADKIEKVRQQDDQMTKNFEKINVIEVQQTCMPTKSNKNTNPYKAIEDKLVDEYDFKGCQKYV